MAVWLNSDVMHLEFDPQSVTVRRPVTRSKSLKKVAVSKLTEVTRM